MLARRSHQGYAQIEAKFFTKITADPGMDPALSVQESLTVCNRENTFVPDPGMDV